MDKSNITYKGIIPIEIEIDWDNQDWSLKTIDEAEDPSHLCLMVFGVIDLIVSLLLFEALGFDFIIYLFIFRWIVFGTFLVRHHIK